MKLNFDLLWKQREKVTSQIFGIAENDLVSSAEKNSIKISTKRKNNFVHVKFNFSSKHAVLSRFRQEIFPKLHSNFYRRLRMKFWC